MNLTLSIDDATVAKARQVAAAQGTSLQEMVRVYLRGLTGEDDRDRAIERLESGWATGPGHSGGYRFRREDAYDDRKVLQPVVATQPTPEKP